MNASLFQIRDFTAIPFGGSDDSATSWTLISPGAGVLSLNVQTAPSGLRFASLKTFRIELDDENILGRPLSVTSEVMHLALQPLPPDAPAAGKALYAFTIALIEKHYTAQTFEVNPGLNPEEMKKLLDAVATLSGSEIQVPLFLPVQTEYHPPMHRNQAVNDILAWYHPVSFNCHGINTQRQTNFTKQDAVTLIARPAEPRSAHDLMEALSQLGEFYRRAGPALGLDEAGQAQRLEELSAISRN